MESIPTVYTYENSPIQYTQEGWINATALAKHFRKRLQNYFDNLETQTYLNMLCQVRGVGSEHFIQAREGRTGGTWLHLDLAIHFGYWLIKRKETATGYSTLTLPLTHTHQEVIAEPYTITTNTRLALNNGEAEVLVKLSQLNLVLKQPFKLV
jgi:hypothetical protein